MSEAEARILARATEILGADSAPSRGEAMAAQICAEALVYCRRSDIPAAMEPVLARLLADELADGEGDASRLKLGDAEVEYFGRGDREKALLQEFRRL